MMKDFFLLAVKSLTHRRMRTFLTIVGIFIGIVAVVALTSLGDGLQNAISGEFQKLGTDKITVMATAGGFITSPTASGISSKPLTTDELETVKKTQGVKLAGAMLLKSVSLKYKDKTKQAFAVGWPMDESRKMFQDMQAADLDVGRQLKDSDTRSVVLGSYAANDLFDKKILLGDTIELTGEKFTVVGIMKSRGNRFDDSSVIMPLKVAREVTGEEKLVSMIIAQVIPGTDIKEVRDRIEKRLRDRRGEKKGEELFSVQTSEQLVSSFASIFGIVQAIVVGIAAISLLVGGIGIMNTMYTSVIERTNEIGVMKAIGAKNSDVLLIFLIESGLLGLIGGLVGVIIGLGLSKLAEIAVTAALKSDLLKASTSPELIIGSLVFSFLVGGISGVLPAIQASKLKPVDALRYE